MKKVMGGNVDPGEGGGVEGEGSNRVCKFKYRNSLEVPWSNWSDYIMTTNGGNDACLGFISLINHWGVNSSPVILLVSVSNL